MGLINIFKPLSTFLLLALSINLSRIEINFQEWGESKLGSLGEKRGCYLCAMQPPCFVSHWLIFSVNLTISGIGSRAADYACVCLLKRKIVEYFELLACSGSIEQACAYFSHFKPIEAYLFFEICSSLVLEHPTEPWQACEKVLELWQGLSRGS